MFYNEDEALSNAIIESIAMQMIPPDQRGIPDNIQGNETGTQIRVREIMESIDKCQQKIKKLVEIDLDKQQIPKTTQNKQSPNSHKSFRNSTDLNSTAELRKIQDEEYANAELEQLRIDEEETSDIEMDFNSSDDDDLTDFGSTTDNSSDNLINENSNQPIEGDNKYIFKINLGTEKPELHFSSSTLGELVYQEVIKRYKNRLNMTDVSDIELYYPPSTTLVRDLTLEEQRMPFKTVLYIK